MIWSRKWNAMKLMFASGVLGLALLSTGCLSPKQYVHFPDQAKRIETSGKARVYMVFPYMSSAASRTFPVYEDGREIGANVPNGYLCWETDPGTKQFSTKMPNLFASKTNLSLTLQPDRVYYLKQGYSPFSGMFSLSLELLSDTEGKQVLQKCSSPED